MNVRELFRDLNIPTAPPGHHHVSRGWVGIDCPWCSPHSGRYRLGVPEDTKGGCTCWVCGPHRLGETLAEITGLPFRTIRERMGEFGGFGGVDTLRPGDRPSEPRITRKTAIPAGAGPLLTPHRRYLRARGLNPGRVAGLWGVGGIGIAPRLSWHLFVPVRVGHEVVSWTTRSIGSGGRRFTSAKPEESKLPIHDLIYGAENARQTIVIFEGPGDVWTFGPGGGAVLGVGVRDAQVYELSRFPVRAVCFNVEPDAQRRARRLCSVLRVLPGDTFNVVLEHGKDLNEAWLSGPAGRREVRELRRRFMS